MKTDIELLSGLEEQLKNIKIASEYMSDVEADNLVIISRADTEQFITSFKRFRNQLSDLSDEYELNLCKKCLHPKAMLCPGEYQCVNTGCV